MRVGVVILPQFHWTEARARWKALEDKGFAHGWTYDHLAWRDLADQDWFGTIPTLAAAATATSTLRLGTWVTSPNFRHPVTLAKDLMTLDDISGGRIIAGIGAGGIGWDAEVLGAEVLPPGQRVSRLDEFVTLVDLLLTQPDTTWHGSYFHVVRARMIPPGSRARLPLVVAANGPRAMKVAARTDGWATTGAHGPEATVDQWWEGVAGLSRRFSDIAAAAAAAGRSPEQFGRYLSVDSAPVFSLSSLDTFTDFAGRAQHLGFTDLVVHWPRPDGVYSGEERVLDQVAALLVDGHVRL